MKFVKFIRCDENVLKMNYLKQIQIKHSKRNIQNAIKNKVLSEIRISNKNNKK